MPITAVRPMLLGTLTSAMALMLGLLPQGAEAIGLGRPQVHSALGKLLDVSIPLNLANGEQLPDTCVRAEVSAGDARVPAGLLRMGVEGEPGQQRIRLQSLVRIDEAALRITLALGCPLQLTREFNVFIETSAVVPAVPAPYSTQVPSLPIEPVQRTLADTSTVPAARPRPSPKPKATGPRLVLERPEVLVSQATPRPATAVPETDLSAELEAQLSQLELTVTQLRAELEARLLANAAAASTAALFATATATAATTAASAASVPSAEALASAPAPAGSPATRPSPYGEPMIWLLTLGLSLLAGAAAFYGSRWRESGLAASSLTGAPCMLRKARQHSLSRCLHRYRHRRPSARRRSATRRRFPTRASISPRAPSRDPWLGPRALIRPFTPAMPTASGALPMSMQATQVLPAQATVASVLSNELTVADELLDLQQQIDFLQMLGQHEAAADLLTTRLSRGSCGAMVYLLLMEICQQRGDPQSFAELVKQFEQRFRTPAPQWASSLMRGRSLEASTSVIAHLQVVWPDPGSAMQMLQDLLSRGSGPGAPHFELPAYRDLLTLYGVARDLFEAGLRSDEVDLLLPLDSKFGEQP